MGGDIEEVTRLKIRHLVQQLELSPTGNDQVKLIPVMRLLLVGQMRLIDLYGEQGIFEKREKFLSRKPELLYSLILRIFIGEMRSAHSPRSIVEPLKTKNACLKLII